MALLLAPLPAQRSAGASDDLLGADKAAHFSVSFVLGAGIYGALSLLGDDDRRLRVAITVPAALLPGLFKEIYDGGQAGNRFSGADLLWDLAGVAAGSCAALLVDVLLARWLGSRARRAALRLAPLAGGAAVRVRWR